MRLFDRRGHRMTMTGEGEAAAHMSRLVSSQETRIRLGCGTPVLHDYFPQWMGAFLRRPENREVRFECSIENTGELIRRLTPLECERLQGFPDGWTKQPGASDSARYKALGNSVAIPCVEFIMRGIKTVIEMDDHCDMD